jgi:hypothetical protein
MLHTADFVWATACLTLRRLAGQNFPLWTINVGDGA